MAGSKTNIVLMGLRGSGKSTLGRLLATRTRRAFVDLDDITPRLLGEQTVHDAWEAYEEYDFRAAETEALVESLQHSGQVIALGGGTPTAPGADKILRDYQERGEAFLIYLRADAQTLRNRMEHMDNRDRPSLTGDDPLEEIEQVFESRDELYRALADGLIQTDELVENEVLDLLEELAK